MVLIKWVLGSSSVVEFYRITGLRSRLEGQPPPRTPRARTHTSERRSCWTRGTVAASSSQRATRCTQSSCRTERTTSTFADRTTRILTTCVLDGAVALVCHPCHPRALTNADTPQVTAARTKEVEIMERWLGA